MFPFRDPEAGTLRERVRQESLQRALGEDYYKGRAPGKTDIFINYPPASEQDVVQAIRVLTAAFPNQSADFWALLTNRFLELRYSRERLKYILHIALDTDQLTNQYRYGRLTVGDFTSITRYITCYTFLEAERHPKDMVFVYTRPGMVNPCDITTREEAIASGFHFIPVFSSI